MPQLDFQGLLVEGGTGFVAGGGQRMAWEASETIGFITTGGVILGGLLGEAFIGQPMLRQVARAAMVSGASVGGWVAAEKFLIEGSQGRRTGHLPAEIAEAQRVAALQAAGAQRAVREGNLNGARVPRAMVPLTDRDVTVL